MKLYYNKNMDHNEYYDKDEQDEEIAQSYLNIWEEIPSFKDISLFYGLVKIGIVGIFGMALIISTYLITNDFFISLFLPSVFIVFLVGIFRENLFIFDRVFQRGSQQFDLFRHFEMWKRTDDAFTIYLSNKKDLLHCGIRIYKIAVIPENVRPNLNHFVKSLYNAKIPFSYQVVQSPEFQDASHTTRIDAYFTLSYYSKGILTSHALTEIRNALEEFSYTFKSICIATLPHFKMDLLHDEDLLEGIQTFLFGFPFTPKKHSAMSTPISPLPLLKGSIILATIIYVDILLVLMDIAFWGVLIGNIALLTLIFGLFWREALYSLTQMVGESEHKIILSHPHTLRFYRVKGYEDYIFLHINNTYLVGMLLMDIEYITPPQFSGKGYFLPNTEKLFRAIINQQLPFSYTVLSSPLSYEEFEKSSLSHLTEYIRRKVLERDTEIEREQWMQMRSGMWRTSQIISLQKGIYSNQPSAAEFDEVATQLDRAFREFRNIYAANLPNYHLRGLSSQKAISGLTATLLKTKFFRLPGTHLDYSILQGKSLMNLCTVAQEFKKGIPTRVAAEFNSPLHITNEITIGYTINTEFLEKEIEAGFTIEQVKNLLITNGSFHDRETTLLTIAAELVKKGVPSIIFDFSGNFSKLLTYFEGTKYEDEFLHFTLGRTLRLDPVDPDLLYDRDKDQYRELLVDVWAMAFKQNQRATQTFREYLKKLGEGNNVDISTMMLEIETQKKWEKSPYADSVIELFKDFTKNAIYVPSVEGESGELEIVPNQFVQNNKTIIIDLSILQDLEQKIFISFIIVAKIIHYIQQYADYYPKLFLIPNADILFDNWYLDRFNHLRYGKINKLIEPLQQRGFGLTITSNQIRYLHPNVFNYFRNIISFRATDSRDISSLKNMINLSELHGVGYYSNSRKDSYQIDFLINLLPGEALVRRDDYAQPYPITIRNELSTAEQMDHRYINEYMLRQGYDLEDMENRILSAANKTLFEIHFHNYIIFLEEIIQFFQVLSKLDKVGNLYKAKIKEELLKLIHPKAKEKFKNNSFRIKQVRDKLFELFLKYNYIIEDHPRRASGSQSIRTSYAVGPQYNESLKDYFASKQERPLEVSVDTIEKESDDEYKLEALFPSENEGDIEDTEDHIKPQEVLETFMDLLMKQYFFDLSQINLYLNKQEYEKVLLAERNILRTFLVNVFCEFHPEETNEISQEQTQKAIAFLDTNIDLPVSVQKLYELIDLAKLGDLPKDEQQERIRTNFDLLLELFHIFQDYFTRSDTEVNH